jgi:hypothetical protein
MGSIGAGHDGGNVTGFAAIRTYRFCRPEKAAQPEGRAARQYNQIYFIMLIFWAFM